MKTVTTASDERGSSTWGATLAGMALFIITGLRLILGEIPQDWTIPTWLPAIANVLFLSFIVLPAIGFGIGWVKGFPRWSYPYVGLELLMSLYMMNVATPGLRILNYTFGSNDLWGWRAWIPFLVMAAIALLVTRSLRPALRLFTNVWEDWTRLTFGMFGFMPLLVLIGFDEVDRLYSLPFMIVLTIVMAGTALGYLRSARLRQRLLALSAGIVLVVVVVTVAPMVYWLENGWVNVRGAIIVGIVVVGVMFSPALIAPLRHYIKPVRPV